MEVIFQLMSLITTLWKFGSSPELSTKSTLKISFLKHFLFTQYHLIGRQFLSTCYKMIGYVIQFGFWTIFQLFVNLVIFYCKWLISLICIAVPLMEFSFHGGSFSRWCDAIILIMFACTRSELLDLKDLCV